MTTSREREQILNEYGAWVEQKTLDGLDLSVEAYLEEVETEEDTKLLDEVRMEVGNYLELERSPKEDRKFLQGLHDTLFPDWKERAIELG